MYDLDFIPEKFNKSIEEIRVKFPLIREVIYSKKSGDTLDLISRINDIQEDEIEKFAKGLKNDELDLPLVAFRTELDTIDTDKLNSILKIRFRKKLFLLNWLILQNNYKNQKLITSMKKLCEIMKEKYPEEYSQTIFGKTNYWDNDPIEGIYEQLKEEKIGVAEFFGKYQFLKKSKFSYDFFVKYFTNAKKEVVLDNWDMFILAINSYVVKESADIIDHYLRSFAPSEYSIQVTNLIAEKYGTDISKGEFWDIVSEESKQRFKKWLYIKIMETYFGADNQIVSFFITYLDEIKKVEYIYDAKLFFIFFENAVLVDNKIDTQTGYLYKNSEFDLELERFMSIQDQAMREWNISFEKVMDAKEAIIDEKKAEIYIISYEFVGRLYLRETIKLEAISKKKKKEKQI